VIAPIVRGRLFQVVPISVQGEILRSRHDALPITGHPGRNRTLGLVSRDYCWPGLQTYVRRYCVAQLRHLRMN